MKTLIRTIAVLISLNVAATGLAMVKEPAAHIILPPEPGVDVQNPEPAVAVQERRKLLDIAAAMQPDRRRSSHAGRILIVPAGQIKAEELVTIMEDMRVMSRILDTRLKDGLFSTEVWELTYFTNAEFWYDKTATGGIYLEGYGALFLKHVGFPLLPPVEESEDGTVEEGSDPVWEHTKQEIYSGRGVPRGGRRGWSQEVEKEYAPDKVEGLKRTLVRTLKHASNMRHLKPDDWVIITVTGTSTQPHEVIGLGGDATIRGTIARGGGMYGVLEKDGKYVMRGTGPFSQTVLTIRARKSDVDAFAGGQLDLDEFRQKVQIILY
jgi:hypothetical protein